MIKLGSRVKEEITGFQGILVSKNTWLNGCIRCNIQPEKLHEGKTIDGEWFDLQTIKLITEATEFVKEIKRPEKLIKLGSEGRHKITGFKGIIIARNDNINGIIRYNIQPEKLREGKIIESEWFASQEIEVVKEKTKFVKKIKNKEAFNGGPQKDPKRFVKD